MNFTNKLLDSFMDSLEKHGEFSFSENGFSIKAKKLDDGLAFQASYDTDKCSNPHYTCDKTIECDNIEPRVSAEDLKQHFYKKFNTIKQDVLELTLENLEYERVNSLLTSDKVSEVRRGIDLFNAAMLAACKELRETLPIRISNLKSKIGEYNAEIKNCINLLNYCKNIELI